MNRQFAVQVPGGRFLRSHLALLCQRERKARTSRADGPRCLQFAPGALKLTPDQVELLRSDNLVSDTAKAAGLTLEGLGIAPDSLEAIAPQYLWRFRPSGQFQRKNA